MEQARFKASWLLRGLQRWTIWIIMKYSHMWFNKHLSELLFSLVMELHWELEQMDVITAFLHGQLE